MQTKKSISPDIASRISQAFKDRAYSSGEGLYFNHQRHCDETLHHHLTSLEYVPLQKWLALCEWSGIEPIHLAAASYCYDFTWENLTSQIEVTDWTIAPWSDVVIAASFISQNALADVLGDSLSLSRLITKEKGGEFFSGFLLSAVSYSPELDISLKEAEALSPEISRLIAWLWARYAYGVNEKKLLEHWARNASGDTELAFWAYFALLLREPDYHGELSILGKMAGEDDIRLIASECLERAITSGPFTSQGAVRAFREIRGGDQLERLTRSLQLAAFVPGRAPLVDPFIQWRRQGELAELLGKCIEDAVHSGASFIPENYPSRQKQEKLPGNMAKTHQDKLKWRMQKRGWDEDAIIAASHNEKAYYVKGYPYGEAVLHFDIQTGKPAVFLKETEEAIHVGRTDYLYNIDTKPLSGMLGGKQSPLPLRREIKPSSPELEIIYIRLKDEWVDVWRPVEAKWLEKNIYIIMPQQLPEDENWEFWVTHHVVCEMRRFAQGAFLVAVRSFLYAS